VLPQHRARYVLEGKKQYWSARNIGGEVKLARPEKGRHLPGVIWGLIVGVVVPKLGGCQRSVTGCRNIPVTKPKVQFQFSSSVTV